MVDLGKLPFRMLTRKYGTQLCYTPMILANHFVVNSKLREQNFNTCEEDRPLFVQFAGHDPKVLLEAARHVEDCCDAVDINLGCP